MAKAADPRTLAEWLGLSPEAFAKLGVLNPTVAIDTRLFIDPLLLSSSNHEEMSGDADTQYREHFERVITLLLASKERNDVAWRSARNLLTFHEIKGTCLGYGAGTIQGSGFGSLLTERALEVGKQIADLGVRDPDLFQAMALFEDDIGPDRLSDMATTVIKKALAKFNKRILGEIGLNGEVFDLGGIWGHFLRNPSQPKRTPVVLVPLDILRVLPIADDWDAIASAASENEALKFRVNQHIAQIFENKIDRDKRTLRAQALASRESFETPT